MKIFTLMTVLATLTACAGSQPIVDLKGVDPAQYRRDLADCQTYADQVPVARKGATRAAVGAVVGGAVGAVVGNSRTVERAAGAGAVIGGAKGTGRGLNERERVVRNCLRNRGYAVLN